MFAPSDAIGSFTTITKRDGRQVTFDARKIRNAIKRCFTAIGQPLDKPTLERYTQEVLWLSSSPTVEGIQDQVENVMRSHGQHDAADAYMSYRANHAVLRDNRPIPAHVREAFAEAARYFPTQLQQFQFYDKYSRFNYDLGRRETWIETVDRTVDALREFSHNRLPESTYQEIREGILTMQVMPSMRLLAMAGPAASRNNVALFNCSFLPVDSLLSFSEMLIVAMAGCGVGYSVERKHVDKLPSVKPFTEQIATIWTVDDSAEGWADALKAGLDHWFNGLDIMFDVSAVRPAGAPLRTKGGRASGPGPLTKLLDFARTRILARQGAKLRPIDAHDIMCAIGEAVVSGGVRRTAQLALFDHDDLEMLHCKDGNFADENPQRWAANNSAVWYAGMDEQEVHHLIDVMFDSGRGEPGIFNRDAANASVPENRKQNEDFGLNPLILAA